jgi:fumarylacetoacetase
MEALAPFRAPLAARDATDPAPLPYLTDARDQTHGGFAVTVEASLRTARMRAEGDAPHRLSRGSARDLFWTFGQMLAHHTVNGCAMRPGDLLGSGTVSGPDKGSRGCLMELTWRGSEPLMLPNGETRAYLEDGDELTLSAFAERDGAVRIGFGTCSGVVVG